MLMFFQTENRKNIPEGDLLVQQQAANCFLLKLGFDRMRKMTLEEFKKFLQEHYDMAGITKEEEEIYYMMYEVGRQSVRW